MHLALGDDMGEEQGDRMLADAVVMVSALHCVALCFVLRCAAQRCITLFCTSAAALGLELNIPLLGSPTCALRRYTIHDCHATSNM